MGGAFFDGDAVVAAHAHAEVGQGSIGESGEFIAQTARRGSFAAAARDLGGSPSTLAKSVARLETQLKNLFRFLHLQEQIFRLGCFMSPLL